ncbi:sec-independent protein translocase protein TatC [Microbacterium endophyticum]|uniref:Sec-independent protein translocase protein TatC n=2 Tax=Microbacterium endophyticum TaxID=1526412 RepID=A0A7W4V4H9_9MICO|nr:sec-independent protein translocase protein TatC [Microbacterium endophyticum]NIK36637.1 sec-independent protein translocase protein TatC [Microbacterium endophyticum]
MVTAGPPRVEEPDAPKRDRRMSLAQHLVELRRRAIIGAIALVIGMIIAALISNQVIDLLTEPIRIVSDSRASDFAALNFNTVTAGFDFHVRIAFAIGILLSAPVWLWQIWAFVMPGLTRKEVRYTVGFLSAAIPLFFAGCALGLWVMPHVIEVMATFVPEQGALFYQYDVYYDFVLKLLLVIGIAFVLPVFLVALNFAGIITGKAILKGWRVAVLSATIFAAIATPAADVLSMLMLGGILIVLYVAAAAVSMLFDRRRSKREESFLASDINQ